MTESTKPTALERAAERSARESLFVLLNAPSRGAMLTELQRLFISGAAYERMRKRTESGVRAAIGDDDATSVRGRR